MTLGKTLNLTAAQVQKELDELETYYRAHGKTLRGLVRALQEEEGQPSRLVILPDEKECGR